MLLLFGILSPARLQAFDGQKPTFVQGMVGAAQFSEQDLTFAETTGDGSTTSDNDLSKMPYFGITFQYPFHGERRQIGLDGSLLFGWRTRDRSVLAADNQVTIKLKSSLWLGDLSLGLYAKQDLGERWRFYIAAGPAMLFGDYSADSDEEDLTAGTAISARHTATEFGFGGYLRGGFDYRYSGDSHVGICVRGLTTNLEFEEAPEASSGLNGVQFFLTFARHF